jgi:hypothetical protein
MCRKKASSISLTVNEIEDIKNKKTYNVNGIISDFPIDYKFCD